MMIQVIACLSKLASLLGVTFWLVWLFYSHLCSKHFTAWVLRVEFHLEQSIAKSKKKDWTNIMIATNEYSNAINKVSNLATRCKGDTMTEEELELVWNLKLDPET